MKITALVLTLLFGGLQTVAVTDCCCISACEVPIKDSGDCRDCAGEKTVPAAQDCCKGPADAEPAPDCLHVQPSHDVAAHGQDVVVAPPAVVLVLPAPEVVVVPPKASSLDGLPGPLHRSERGRSLFLLDATFLI